MGRPQRILHTSTDRRPGRWIGRWGPVCLGPLAAIVASLACNPNTSRPPFAPLPQAKVDTVTALRTTVLADLAARLSSEGLELRHTDARDGYLETRPFDPILQKRRTSDRTQPDHVVTFRFWIDSLPNRQTRITSEITHSRATDPSLPPRVNEVMTQPGEPGWEIYQRILTGVRTRFSG
jgi:hypothetical protein